MVELEELMRAPKSVPKPQYKPVDILMGHKPEIRDLAEQLRKIIRKSVPEAVEVAYPVWHGIGYRHPEAGYLGGIFPMKNCVKLGFEWGAFFPDPKKELQGTGGRVRYLVFKRKKDVKIPTIRKFLRYATSHQKPGGIKLSH